MKKMLKKSEELGLARAWLERGDEAARARLLDSYQPMVRNIARKYLRGGLSLEDLVQEGNIGFLSALDNFEPDKGYAVGTLARFHIRARVQLYVSEFAGIIRLPNSRRIKGLLANCVSKIRFEENLRGVTLTKEEKAAICKDSGYSIEELEQYEMVMKPSKSINSQAASDDEESGFELVDTKADTEAAVIQESGLSTGRDALLAVLSGLPARTQKIIAMRHLSDGFVSLDTIAGEVGISRERVRRVEKDALVQIRRQLGEMGIRNLSDLF